MAVTLISSFSARFLSAGTVTFQSPLSSAFPVSSVPSGSVTVTSEPAGALPLISLSPAFGFSTVGFAVFSVGVTAFGPTIAFTSSDGVLPVSVCIATTSSPLARVISSGTFTDQIPSLFTVASPIISWPLVTTICDPATPLPEIVLSFSVTSLITGFLDVSFFLVAVAVIFALSFVIAVPGVVDHVGFSNPSFAVAVGYLSTGRTVPSFTS